RGVALIPTFAFTTREDSFDVNLLMPGKAELTLGNGKKVKVTVRTDYPVGGKAAIEAATEGGGPGSFRVRGVTALNGKVEIDQPLEPKLVPGDRSNPGRAAVMRGPMVYCLEKRFNPSLPGLVGLAGDDAKSAGLEAVPAPVEKAAYPGQLLV